eukprot:EG_transcript_20025
MAVQLVNGAQVGLPPRCLWEKLNSGDVLDVESLSQQLTALKGDTLRHMQGNRRRSSLPREDSMMGPLAPLATPEPDPGSRACHPEANTPPASWLSGCTRYKLIWEELSSGEVLDLEALNKQLTMARRGRRKKSLRRAPTRQGPAPWLTSPFSDDEWETDFSDAAAVAVPSPADPPTRPPPWAWLLTLLSSAVGHRSA